MFANWLSLCLCWVVSVLVVLGCDPAQQNPGKHEAEATGPTPSGSVLAPLAAAGPIVELEASKSWAAVPRGAREPRPILVFWDGLSANTRETCQRLFELSKRQSFVLCRKAQAGPSDPKASADLKGGLRLLKQRFGGHVAGESVVFIASGEVVPASLEAVRQAPSFFSRIALVSEDRIPWTATLASVFAKGGGLRVLFVCLSEPCQRHTTHPIRWLQRQGAKARLGQSKASSDKQVPLASGDWQWLIEGDERFVVSGKP